jgi:hypothetical protein
VETLIDGLEPMMTEATTSFAKRIRHAGATVLAATLLSLPFSGGALALASFDSSVLADLRITGFRDIGGTAIPKPGATSVSVISEVVPDAADLDEFLSLLFTGNDLSGKFTLSPPAAASGSGAATANAGIDGIGAGSTQSASVSGAADDGGVSLALQLTNGFLTIDNTGGPGLFVDFSLDYSWSISAAASDFVNEFAEAIASILVDTVVFTTDPDADGAFDTPVDLFDIIDTTFGSNISGASDTILFSIFIGAGQTAYVDMFVDAAGDAAGIPVPAPASALVLLFGLAALRRVRGRAGNPA